MHEFNVTLYRDSLSTPWGIRLEGGSDFFRPLTIQRVFAGSPASGELQRGDVILRVQNHNASHLYHHEANEIIKNSGGSISFTIRRGLNFVPMSSSSSTLRPHQMAANYGPPKHAMTSHVNYAPHAPSHLYEAEDPLQSYIRSRPIEKLKNPKPILSQTGSPIMPGDTPNMGGLRVQTMKRFRPASTLPMLGSANSASSPYSPSYYDDMSFTPTSPSSQFTFHAPLPSNHPSGPYSQQLSYPYTNSMNTVPVPFSERRMASQLQHSVTRAAANKYNQPAHSYHHQQHQQQHHHQPAPSSYPFSPSSVHHQTYHPQQHQHQHQQQQYSSPPWKDSLQQSSPGVRMSGSGAQSSPKSPKVVNLQYNTPIGLYSRDNIREELHKQIGNTNLPFVPASEF